MNGIGNLWGREPAMIAAIAAPSRPPDQPPDMTLHRARADSRDGFRHGPVGFFRRLWLRFIGPGEAIRWVNHRPSHYRRGGWR